MFRQTYGSDAQLEPAQQHYNLSTVAELGSVELIFMNAVDVREGCRWTTVLIQNKHLNLVVRLLTETERRLWKQRVIAAWLLVYGEAILQLEPIYAARGLLKVV